MADIGKSLKSAWMKGMEAIGNTASNIASNTKYKVNEMNLINRRREILSEFGAQAYELWQKGTQFPEELQKQLEELSQLDEQLNAIRTERLAGVKTGSEEAPAEDDATADTLSDDDVPTIDMPATESPEKPVAPLEDAIDTLINKTDDAVNRMADAAASSDMESRVNDAIDTMSQAMTHLSDDMDKAIGGMDDALHGSQDDQRPSDPPTLS